MTLIEKLQAALTDAGFCDPTADAWMIKPHPREYRVIIRLRLLQYDRRVAAFAREFADEQIDQHPFVVQTMVDVARKFRAKVFAGARAS